MSPQAAALRAAMPALFAHAGVWEGVYRTVDLEGRETDRHASRIAVAFPQDGPFAYLQSNRFTWADGRVAEAEHPERFGTGRSTGIPGSSAGAPGRATRAPVS